MAKDASEDTSAQPAKVASQFAQYRDPAPGACGSESAASQRDRGAEEVLTPLSLISPLSSPPPQMQHSQQLSQCASQQFPSMAQVFRYAPLPPPNDPGAPYFDGEDASDFLQKMCDTCHRSGIKDYPDILEFVPQYCARVQRKWVEKQSSWKNKDWESFKESFLDRYYDDDSEQQRYTWEYLQRLSQIERTMEDDIQTYLDEFEEISDELTKRGDLEDVYRAELLIRGLPEDLQRKVILHLTKKGLTKSCRNAYDEAFTFAESEIRGKAALRRYLAQREDPILPKPEQKLSTKEKHSKERSQQRPAEPSTSRWQEEQSRKLDEISSKLDALGLMIQASQGRRNDYRHKPTWSGPPNDVEVNELVQ